MKQYRYVDGNSGYFGYSQLPIYFAIPNDAQVKLITIKWPSGKVQHVENLELNTALKIVEK